MDKVSMLSRDDLRARFGSAVRIGEDADISPDITIEIEPSAVLTMGARVSIRRGVTIQVSREATLSIGDDVSIGENVFVSALVGIRIGDGCGISNMVDIHDVNHRDRSINNLERAEWTPYASGFEGAPIIIESGAIISNKCSLTAGVRVGYNSIVGANSVVTKSIPPNSMAAGAPAVVVKSFDAIPPAHKYDGVREMHFGFFGTSIMEHLEGYSERLQRQWDLPLVGTQVPVAAWRNRGYVHQLRLALQAAHPHLRFRFENYAQGGFTSRNIATAIKEALLSDPRWDLVFYECGINDVWRSFQNRESEAVGLEEFESNYRQSLRLLKAHARRVVCIGQTPFGLADSAEMNKQLAEYNRVAEDVANSLAIDFINPWLPFRRTAQAIHHGSTESDEIHSVWSDGVHLSELGDSILFQMVYNHLNATGLIRTLERYEVHERSKAVTLYRPLFESYRSEVVLALARPKGRRRDQWIFYQYRATRPGGRCAGSTSRSPRLRERSPSSLRSGGTGSPS